MRNAKIYGLTLTMGPLRTAVFLTVFTGQKSKLRQVQILLSGDGLKQGVAVVIVAAYKNKGFNDVP